MSKQVGEKCGNLWLTDRRIDGELDGHHHPIIRPVRRRAYKNGNRRYKYVVLGHDKPNLLKKHSDSNDKYNDDHIIEML